MLDEVIKMILKIDDVMIWVYMGLFILLMYLVIGLLTWSIIKPLKYLGIPTLITGILFIIIRFIPNIVISILDVKISVIKAVLPSVLKPIFIYGISSLLIGLVMIILYNLFTKKAVNNC